jgi:Zn/Cd-binding protein ZinT
MQANFKLIMNSAYGKSIQRPIESDYKFKREHKDYDNFIYTHYHSIIEDVTIQDSTIHLIKEVKPIIEYINFTLLGVQILSMSKRIMNELM